MMFRQLFARQRYLGNYYLSSYKFYSLTTKQPNENDLLRFILDKIHTSGPITVAEYVQLCVSSQLGYYSKQEAFPGMRSKGDFITSPGLSQVFGELIGAWIVNELQMTGWEGRWQLVELGPGTGELMVDLLCALHKLGKSTNVDVHLVEKSELLVERQRNNLGNKLDAWMPSVNWHQSLDDVPEGFTVFVANEFLDALPVHLFARDDGKSTKWREQYVNIDRDDGHKLCFMLSSGENIHTRAWIPQRIRAELTRNQWEFCPQANHIVLQMVRRFTSHGGFALIIDYGHDGSRQTHSLRAYKEHQLVDPLQSPGEVDLTADVDFGELITTVRDKCLAFGPVEQRHFLGRIGLAHRMDYLLSKCKSGDERRSLLDACRMLIADDQMGSRFKALALFPNTLAEIIRLRGGTPAGFVTTDANEKSVENGNGKN